MVKRVLSLAYFFVFLFFGLCPSSEAANPQPQKFKFFNLDLHISVIADVKTILESMGHEVVSWSLSEHTWIMGKSQDRVDVVNAKTWMKLDPEMCNRFYERYKGYLSQFDGFIVTHNASFALLYEKFNKPIIIVNSTRYENPFTGDGKRWNWLNHYLKDGVEKNKIFIISNNKGDQWYLKHYTGLKSVHIPSLCLYTKAVYTGKTPGFIVHSLPTSHRLTKAAMKRFKCPNLIQNHQLPKRYAWETLYDFQGVIHFPYNISTMSLFEQYSANVPIFFPSKKFLLLLKKKYRKQILSQLSFFPIRKFPIPSTLGVPNNIYDKKVVDRWIDSADFYDLENMPYIQYFDSFGHLEQLLKTVDFSRISEQMKEHNIKRQKKVFRQWEELLRQIEF